MSSAFIRPEFRGPSQSETVEAFNAVFGHYHKAHLPLLERYQGMEDILNLTNPERSALSKFFIVFDGVKLAIGVEPEIGKPALPTNQLRYS